jgi:hypothetical protein
MLASITNPRAQGDGRSSSMVLAIQAMIQSLTGTNRPIRAPRSWTNPIWKERSQYRR